MEFLCKVGPKRQNSDPLQPFDLLDGQIISVKPNGHYQGQLDRVHFCVIETPHNFAAFQSAGGVLDVENTDGLWLKRLINPTVNGYYKWDTYFPSDVSFADYLMRDWFIDYRLLIDTGLITLVQYKSIYDKSRSHDRIYLEGDPTAYLRHEGTHSRLAPHESIDILPGTIDAAGTYTVGTGQTYSDWSTACADLPADIGAMTTPGDIILQGNTNEELATEDSNIVISLNTDVYALKINVAAGVKHSGTYGGHRIQFGNYDAFYFDEVSGSTLNNVQVQDVSFKSAGNYAYHLAVNEGFKDDFLLVERCIANLNGIGRTFFLASSNFTKLKKLIFRNNIAYDGAAQYAGIAFTNSLYSDADTEVFLLNNTLKGCHAGIYIGDAINSTATFVIKDNLCIDNTTDYDENGNGWTNITTAKNISKDSTSPDGATYQGYTSTSVFNDYANDDYTLAATDALLDDGEDLSAIGSPEQFSDDIIGQTRSTWFIGASEYVSSGPTSLSLTNIDSATVVSSLVLTTIKNISLSNVVSDSQLTDTILSLIEAPAIDITLQDIESASEITNIFLTIVKDLNLINIDVTTEIQNLIFTVIKQVGLQNIDSETSVSSISTQLIKLLTLSNVDSLTEITDQVISSANTLNLQKVSSLAEITLLTLTVLRNVSLDNVNVSTEVSEAVIQTIKNIEISNVESLSEITNIVVSTSISLGITDTQVQSEILAIVLGLIRFSGNLSVASEAQLTSAVLSVIRKINNANVEIATQVTNLTLEKIGFFVLSALREIAVAVENRVITVAAENRVITI